MKLPSKIPRHGHKKELEEIIFSSNSPSSQKWYLKRFFSNTQNIETKFRNMITHDCLKVINKNFTVILIFFLYLAKFSSNKIANNVFFGLICMKNELS